MAEPLTVVIVHREQPVRCVRTGRALLAQGVPVRLLVVDNDSSDAARAALAAGLRDAEVIDARRNLGFGPAANLGLRRWLSEHDGEWVAIAPHDALPEVGCLARLLGAVTGRPRAGLASAEYGEPLVPVVDPYFGPIQLPVPGGDGWAPAGHPHGTLMLARRSCLEDVGLFDERYFAYGEEADLGVRARRAGWEVGVVFGAVVHNPSLSTAEPVVEYLQLRNSLLLVRSHYGRYRVSIRFCTALLNTGRLLVRPSRRPPIFDLRARRRALEDFLGNRYGPPPLDL